MNDIYREFLITILVLLFTVITAVVSAYCKHKIAQINNESVRQLLFEIDGAFDTAVTAVNQTFVDGLKKEKRFNEDEQEEARTKATTTFWTLVSDSAKKLLFSMYEDEDTLNSFIRTKIEEKVKNQKDGISTLASL